MKKIILTAALIVSVVFGYSQTNQAKITSNITPISIPLDSVQSYIGKLVKVTGKVYGTKETGKVAFINVGGSYPNAPLTLFISNAYLLNFKDKPISSYDGKTITVIGKLEEYNGKPQIIIQSFEGIIMSSK